MFAEAGEFLPVLAAVGGAEEGGVFDAGVDGVGVGERRLEVPDALELPRVRGAVVPLMGAGDAVVDEFVADGVPCGAAIVGTLHDLPEPTAGLRGVDTVGICGRTLKVVKLPASEVGAADFPVLALAVRGEDERAFFCTNEQTDFTHAGFLLWDWSGYAQLLARGTRGRRCAHDERRRHQNTPWGLLRFIGEIEGQLAGDAS